MPLTGVTLGSELPCGAQEAVRCVMEPNGSGDAPASPPTVPTLPPATLPPPTGTGLGLPLDP